MADRWIDEVDERLRPSCTASSPLALDLFAGCGGLSLGYEAAGFRTHGMEADASAAASYGRNLRGPCEQLFIGSETAFPKAEVVIGGPPCQPFSVRGKQAGDSDARNGFPSFLRAVDEGMPTVAVFENVRGMLYRNKDYFELVVDGLRKRGYNVDWKLLNASRFGVPQKRERLFVVASKRNFTWPSEDVQVVTVGQAIGETALAVPEGVRFLTPAMDRYIAEYEKKSKCRNPRDIDLSKPCRTVTCRNIASATSDMLRLRLPDGRRRMLTLREAARIQSFPDWFMFEGNDASVAKQIGNAVPPLLSLAVAEAVLRSVGG